jgi:hypothetical protein
MRRIILTLALACSTLALTGTANAQPGRGLGVGAGGMLDGPVGAMLVYDAGAWHMDALLGVTSSSGNTDFDIGARFWFHVHSLADADFSVGGGLGVSDVGNNTFVDLEAGAHIRAFIVPNVSLGGSVGINVLLGDGEGFVLRGQRGFTGGMNFIYYFQ